MQSLQALGPSFHRLHLMGLKKLYTQVSLVKEVDHTYAKALASYLAYIVFKHEFDKRKKWFVDPGSIAVDPDYENTSSTAPGLVLFRFKT